MAINFNALRSQGNSLDAANKLAEKLGQKKNYDDDRFWKPTWNTDLVSENIIRFLPVSLTDMEKQEAGEIEIASPMVTVKKHFFKGPKGWYVENSLQTLGENCPVVTHDAPLWKGWTADGKPDNQLKQTLMNRISRDETIVNIYVIKDTNVPENNGKNFLYKITASIQKKIEMANQPKFAGVEPIDVFNLFTGATLLLNLTGTNNKNNNGKSFIKPNFDECKWVPVGPLFDNDADMEKVWKASYSLAAFLEKDNFKTYEQLEAKFFKVMGYQTDAGSQATPNDAPAQKNLKDYQTSPAQEQTPPAETESSSIPGKPTETKGEAGEAGAAIGNFESLLMN